MNANHAVATALKRVAAAIFQLAQVIDTVGVNKAPTTGPCPATVGPAKVTQSQEDGHTMADQEERPLRAVVVRHPDGYVFIEPALSEQGRQEAAELYDAVMTRMTEFLQDIQTTAAAGEEH